MRLLVLSQVRHLAVDALDQIIMVRLTRGWITNHSSRRIIIAGTGIGIRLGVYGPS